MILKTIHLLYWGARNSMKDEYIDHETFVLGEVKRFNTAINIFAQAMKDKMEIKARDGFTGWDNPNRRDDVLGAMIRLLERIKAGDLEQAVDMGNFAMMLHFMDCEIKAHMAGGANCAFEII